MIVTKRGVKHVLIMHDTLDSDSSDEQVLAKLTSVLEDAQLQVQTVATEFDAEMTMVADPMIQAILLDWCFCNDMEHATAMRIIKKIRARDRKVPIFLFAKHVDAGDIPVDILKATSDFIWLYEDTADFIAGRITVAMDKYEESIMPPLFKALKKFSDVHEYSWHTPGHTGGTAFLKSAAGRAFYDYFGENLFRSDLSISVGDLGSLLDHSGPIGASERYAAKIFGAHRTYSVTNGSSTSNRIIFMACVTRGQIALCDRNAHKSTEQAMTMTGALPQYLMPLRNFYGIIGPIPPERLQAAAIKKGLKANPLAKLATDPNPVHAIITNSTYDGLCYNVQRVEELLCKTVDRMHFDEAWYGYARFNPIYKNRFAMYGDPKEHKKTDMTVLCTQSTHKLLAALSQASFIHIREGKKNISHTRFNEAFMMHASTSPFYPIIASNDVTAAMMENNGLSLTTDSITEAVAFRKLISKIHAEYAAKGDWFFNCWQPDTIKDAKTGKQVPFYKASTEQLATDPECWVLHPKAAWHGFGDIEEDYCMLDPIKVSVTTPGISPKGLDKSFGIPASVLSAYLSENGIVPEKTTDYTILFLFSLGITKGKWGTLVDYLLQFKQDYDENTSLEQCLPSILAAGPERYEGMGLRDLCAELFAAQKEFATTKNMAEAFATLPHPDMPPVEAYEHLVRDEVETVDLAHAANRTLATGIVPYPPGIPLVMPGENFGNADGPALSYMKSLEAIDKHFPGFGHDTHGVEVENGKYYVTVLKAKKTK